MDSLSNALISKERTFNLEKGLVEPNFQGSEPSSSFRSQVRDMLKHSNTNDTKVKKKGPTKH